MEDLRKEEIEFAIEENNEELELLPNMSDELLADMSDEEMSCSEGIFDILQAQAEAKRMEQIQEDYKVSKEVKNSLYFKEGEKVAQTLVAMVKEMSNNGIRYEEAIQIASAFYQFQEAKQMRENSNDYKEIMM